MKQKSTLGVVVTVAVVLAMIPFAIAEEPSVRKGSVAATPATGTQMAPGTQVRAVGTIQYDNDTPFSRLANTADLVGNRFDSLVDPHSIASVSFRVAQNYLSSVGMSIWEVNPPNVSRLLRVNVGGIPQTTVTGTVFTYPLATPIVAHTGSFIAGIHNTAYTGYGCPTNTNLNGTCDGVALSQGATGMAPFHGAYINIASSAFTPLTNVVASTGQPIAANAIFRVTGDNLPVELMSFTAE